MHFIVLSVPHLKGTKIQMKMSFPPFYTILLVIKIEIMPTNAPLTTPFYLSFFPLLLFHFFPHWWRVPDIRHQQCCYKVHYCLLIIANISYGILDFRHAPMVWMTVRAFMLWSLSNPLILHLFWYAGCMPWCMPRKVSINIRIKQKTLNIKTKHHSFICTPCCYFGPQSVNLDPILLFWSPFRYI